MGWQSIKVWRTLRGQKKSNFNSGLKLCTDFVKLKKNKVPSNIVCFICKKGRKKGERKKGKSNQTNKQGRDGERYTCRASERNRAPLTSLSAVKNPPANAGHAGSIPGSQRSPGEGHGYPLQYSCLGSPMDRGTWRATVHGVTESDTTYWLNNNNGKDK